jgi:arylsulfatase A-like enzyme
MKLIRFLILSAALTAFSPAARAEDLAALFTNVTPAAARGAQRTSIIFIQCHGLGYGDLSCYGQTNFQTPNLDRLAAGGVRFTSFYAGDAGLSPAQAVLLTGRDSAHLRQRDDAEVPLAANETTLAQRLQQAGYHTGLIGEWTLGAAPWTQGFDEFAGFLNGDEGRNYYPDHLWRYAPNSLLNTNNNRMETYAGREMLYPNTDGKKGQYLPDLLMKATLNFIQNNQPDKYNRFRPFFLLVSLPAPRTATAGADDFPVPTDAPFTGESWPQAAKNRAALITRLDTSMGQLLEKLDRPGFSNNIAVFFTSDAGPEKFADKKLNAFAPAGALRGRRGELYEGALRVPFIVRWREQIPAGSRNDFPAGAWDFAPTALDIAGLKPGADMDGISLLPALSGRAPFQPHEIFFRWELRGRATVQAARLGEWKAVRANPGEKWELYHLKTDPGETENVADKYPEIIKSIEGFWSDAAAPGSHRVWPAQISTNSTLLN